LSESDFSGGLVSPFSCSQNCIDGTIIAAALYPDVLGDPIRFNNLVSQYSAVITHSVAAYTDSKEEIAYSDLWSSRLITALQMIDNASLEELTDGVFVANVIRLAGLVFDDRFFYGDDNRFMNAQHAGLWQMPDQLSRCLIFLSQFAITSVAEIGTWCGWTLAITVKYLQRFNSALYAIAIDSMPQPATFDIIKAHLPISYKQGTCRGMDGHKYDLVLIDADHSYKECAADYHTLGRAASICVFHDIADDDVIGYVPNEGGVARLWREIADDATDKYLTREFTDHPGSKGVMGIGVVVNRTSIRCFSERASRAVVEG
jgi:hypothetical protein